MKFEGFIKAYKEWVIPVATGALFPWQDQLTKLELIASYYQPSTNLLLTILSSIGAMAGYALLHSQTKDEKRRWLKRAIWLTIVFFALTVLINFTLGRSWHPEGGLMYTTRIVWWFSYVGAFVALTQIVLAAFILIFGEDGDKK